jgi:NTE family protein
LKRQKDIAYPSRTRYASNMVAELSNTRKAITGLITKLPRHLPDDPEVKHLKAFSDEALMHLLHLIYRQGPDERESKDYEFSLVSVLQRWEAGRRDLRDVIQHLEWLKCAGEESGTTQYDLAEQNWPFNSLAQ